MGYHKEMYLAQFYSNYTPHYWVILPENIRYSFMHMLMTNKPNSASSLPSRVQKKNVLIDFKTAELTMNMDAYQPFKT